MPSVSPGARFELQGRRPIVLLVVGALAGAALAAAGLTVPSAGGALPPGVVAMVNGEPVRFPSFDNVQVGATMAEVLEPTIDDLGLDSPRVVMLNGGEEDNNSFLFRDGYAETVEARVDAGDWTLVADQHVPGWDNDEAQTIMEQILVDASNGVDAVFAAPVRDYRARSKEVLVMQGVIQHAYMRPPLLPVSAEDRQRLKKVLEEAGEL